MTNEEIVIIIRTVAANLEAAGPEQAAGIVAPFKAFTSAGLHEGRRAEMNSSDAGFRIQLEWYAGQLLSIIDAESYFAVNSWFNLVDKFTTPNKED